MTLVVVVAAVAVAIAVVAEKRFLRTPVVVVVSVAVVMLVCLLLAVREEVGERGIGFPAKKVELEESAKGNGGEMGRKGSAVLLPCSFMSLVREVWRVW